MRTPNAAEQLRRSREVKSNRDSEEVDRVKSKQLVEASGQSGVDTAKPPAYHSVPSGPVSDPCAVRQSTNLPHPSWESLSGSLRTSPNI